MLYDSLLLAGPRIVVLRILQSVITGQQYKDDKKAMRRKSFVAENKSGINKTIAVLSKKQQDEIHNYMFKCALLKDNQPRMFVELHRTFHLLLKQYRNKELEGSVPLMFRLQELCGQENSVLDKSLSRAVQTLVAAYFALLAHTYKGNSELENYVHQVINGRVETNQISSSFLKTFTRFTETMEKSERQEDMMEEMDAIFTYVIQFRTSEYAAVHH